LRWLQVLRAAQLPVLDPCLRRLDAWLTASIIASGREELSRLELDSKGGRELSAKDWAVLRYHLRINTHRIVKLGVLPEGSAARQMVAAFRSPLSRHASVHSSARHAPADAASSMKAARGQEYSQLRQEMSEIQDMLRQLLAQGAAANVHSQQPSR
jgi:hypothetical protein